MTLRKLFVACCCLSLALTSATAQDKLYPNTFPLGDVKLLDGPFKHACDLNVDVLLQYDVDRLLAPFLKEAGLPKKAEVFPNWSGLDGHVGGHYLSALAIHYAATGNPECKRRMDYMLDEMKRCQDANGNGYVGGVPDGMRVWDEIEKGNVGIVWKYWVPWYNMHKVYAGLRDAWSYAGSQQARDMFLRLCDWGLTVIAPLSDEQMEQMLDSEFGGMDEVYADAYRMTGDRKYLDICNVLGLPAKTPEEATAVLADAVLNLGKEIGIDMNFQSLVPDEKVWESHLEEIAYLAYEDQCTPCNPREPLVTEMMDIMRKAYKGN